MGNLPSIEQTYKQTEKYRIGPTAFFNIRMLFRLHNDFSDLSVIALREYVLVLTELLAAHRKGDHVFLPSRPMLNVLLECDFLGMLAKATLSEIRSKYVELESLADLVERFAVVYDPGLGHAGVGGPRQFGIDCKRLISGRYLSPFVLVVESINTDGEFWRLIFAAIAFKQFSRWGFPRFDIANGGGDTLASVLVYHCKQSMTVCCIADSDKRSKYAPLGKTALNAKQELINHGFIAENDDGLSSLAPNAGLYILSVREAENLVPLRMVRDVLSHIHSSNYDILEKAIISSPDNLSTDDLEILTYYDFKTPLGAMTDFYDPREEPFFDKIFSRVGMPAPRIREGLLADLVAYCSEEKSMQRKAQLSKALWEGPFKDELLKIFNGAFALACRPQSKWF